MSAHAKLSRSFAPAMLSKSSVSLACAGCSLSHISASASDEPSVASPKGCETTSCRCGSSSLAAPSANDAELPETHHKCEQTATLQATACWHHSRVGRNDSKSKWHGSAARACSLAAPLPFKRALRKLWRTEVTSEATNFCQRFHAGLVAAERTERTSQSHKPPCTVPCRFAKRASASIFPLAPPLTPSKAWSTWSQLQRYPATTREKREDQDRRP